MMKLNVGEKNGFFGKTHSDEFKLKHSRIMKGRLIGSKNGRAKEIVIDGIKYGSLTEAKEMLKLSKGKLKKIIGKTDGG